MNDTTPRSSERFAWNLTVVPLCMSGLLLGLYATASADESHNVALIGYHHLQGRQALQVTTKSDSANGNWVYIGHVPNTRTRDATLNPITGRDEWNGTSIVEITDPRIDGSDLVYSFKLIEGSLPAAGGATSLFIDWIGVGGGVGRGFHGVGVGRRGPGVRGW